MSEERLPILVGVDGSPASVAALRYAHRLADATEAPVRVVTAWETVPVPLGYPSESRNPRDHAAELAADSIRCAYDGPPPPNLEQVILEGPPTRALIEESRNARMLVLGTRGAGGFANLLLGSVSAACAAHAHCPVLLIRATATEQQTTED